MQTTSPLTLPGVYPPGIPACQEPKYGTNSDGRLFNRSTGEPIPDDEPVFVLRAQDTHAYQAIAYYLSLCHSSDHRTVVKSRLLDFANFADKHRDRMKLPDSSTFDLASANLGPR